MQSRLALNDGKEKMFEEALIGPQRKAPPPLIEPPQQPQTTSETIQETMPTEQTTAEQPTTVEIKEEPMEVQAKPSGQEPSNH
jgi:hypothetical protein